MLPQRSDSRKLVYPIRVLRFYDMADPIKYHPLAPMPPEVHNYLFDPGQEDYNNCLYDVRAGLNQICVFALRKRTFACFIPEIDRWYCLADTNNLPCSPRYAYQTHHMSSIRLDLIVHSHTSRDSPRHC